MLASPYNKIPESDISYSVIAATTDEAVQSLNSQCSMDHAPPNSLVGLYFTREDEIRREITIDREDIKNFKAIGLVAQIKDKNQH
jgi:hypothetical protein